MEQTFKFRLESAHLELIHLLRILMLPCGFGLFDRSWEIPLNGLQFAPLGVPEPLFPETDDDRPLLIDGVRLMERIALSTSIEDDTIVLRLCQERSRGYDLYIYVEANQPNMIIETDDEDLYLKVKAQVEKKLEFK